MGKEDLRTWEEARRELFTAEEIAESDLRVALIGELINAEEKREKKQSEAVAI